MDTIQSSATLPIQQIRDVNLAWVRQDLGDLTDLRESIRRDGLQLPILMTQSMYVADGARRLEACGQLGYTTVPVLVTSDWNLVVEYYAAVRRATREGWPTKPMAWQDLADLLNGPMKELYSERYRKLRKEIWDRNNRARRGGAQVIPEKKNLYTTACAEVLGFRNESDLRTIRELHTTLHKMDSPAGKGEDPTRVTFRHTWAKTLREQLIECEEKGGDRLYAVMARVRMANRGEDPSTVKQARGRRPRDTEIDREEVEEKADAPAGRQVDAVMLASIDTMLSQLAGTLHYYTDLRPTLSASDAARTADSMKASVRKINALIKIVRDYGTKSSNPNLEERA